MGFTKKTKYYTGTVYEWKLPAGHSCPGALECLVKVVRDSGRADNRSAAFRCYAASAERFPAVRKSRWENYDAARRGEIPDLPSGCRAVRIHASGDFFNADYFGDWLDYCRARPCVEFWAYTKSVNLWAERLADIPANLALTASRGGRYDELIDAHGLRCATVVPGPGQAGGPIDTNDDLARGAGPSFFLVDNNYRAPKVAGADLFE